MFYFFLLIHFKCHLSSLQTCYGLTHVTAAYSSTQFLYNESWTNVFSVFCETMDVIDRSRNMLCLGEWKTVLQIFSGEKGWGCETSVSFFLCFLFKGCLFYLHELDHLYLFVFLFWQIYDITFEHRALLSGWWPCLCSGVILRFYKVFCFHCELQQIHWKKYEKIWRFHMTNMKQ